MSNPELPALLFAIWLGGAWLLTITVVLAKLQESGLKHWMIPFILFWPICLAILLIKTIILGTIQMVDYLFGVKN